VPVIGVLTLELHIEDSRSLKDKRHVVKSLKDRLRERFNVAVAEIDHLDSWQNSVLAVVTVSNDRVFAEQVLQAAEHWWEPAWNGCNRVIFRVLLVMGTPTRACPQTRASAPRKSDAEQMVLIALSPAKVHKNKPPNLLHSNSLTVHSKLEVRIWILTVSNGFLKRSVRNWGK
jgi:uncharacterized protein YlxP (DUF503 family)